MDTAGLLEKTLGIFGRWQGMLVFLILLSKISVVYHTLMQLPQHYSLPFECSDPAIDKCSKDCPDVVYDTHYLDSTVITEWKLICEKSWVTATIQSVVMFGILLGNVLLGWVSDKWGRRNVLVAEIVLQVISGVGAGLVSNLALFVLLRFVSTFATGGMMLTSFILLMEYIAPKYRTLLCILFQMPGYFAYASIGPIAYLCRRWDYIQIACSGPNIILVSYICLLPESARWLLAKNRNEEVIKTLEKAAKCNRLPTESIRQDVETFVEEQKNVKTTPPGRMSDLFSTRRMRMKTIILSINWFVISNLYYGIAQMMGHIAGNFYWNVFIGGLVQIPGNLSCIFVCDWIGRKWSLIASYVATFVPMFICLVLPTDPAWPRVCCGSVSLMGSAMSFTIIYLYSGEMLPTVVRNAGMGIMSMTSRVGSMLSPIIMYAALLGDWVPYVIFGVQPVIACVFTLIFLPETNKVPLPNSIDEANEL